MRRLAIAGFLVLAAVLSTLSSVQAQGLDPVTMTLTETQRAPEGRLAPVTGKMVVTYDLSVVVPGGHQCRSPSDIALEPTSGPAYALFALEPQLHRLNLDAAANQTDVDQTRTYVYRVEAVVVANNTAPALATAGFDFSAALSPPANDPACTVASTTATAQFDVEIDYAPFIDLIPPEGATKARPGRPYEFLLDISNLGNGPTVLAVTAAFEQQEAGGTANVDAVPELPSRATDGESAATTATVRIYGKAPGAAVSKSGSFAVIVDVVASHPQATGNATGLATDAQTLALNLELGGVSNVGFGIVGGLILVAGGGGAGGFLFMRSRGSKQ